MNNFLKELNIDTKIFVLHAFNLIDWLHANKGLIKIDGKELSDGDEVAISFFLAGLKHIKEVKNIYSKYNIDYSTCFEKLNTTLFDYSKIDYRVNYDINSLEKTDTFKRIDFNIIKNDFLPLLKERLSTDDLINIRDIESYQIFYYIITRACHNINKLKVIFTNIDDKNLFNELNVIVIENDTKFVNKINSSNSRKLCFDNVIFYFYEDGKMTIKLNNKSSISLTDGNESFDFILENECDVLYINGKKANIQVLSDAVIEEKISLDLYDSILCKNIPITCDCDSLFSMPKLERDTNIDSSTPYLDKYGNNLTKAIYLKDPSIGREDEIRKIEQILLYPEKDKSIVIVGEAGCGKTAIVRGLAYRIQNGNVPKPLKDLKIYSISTSTLVAGTKYVGTLEEKMKNILDEASKDKNIIIFIDEIHQAIGGGKSEGNNNTVSEILKPYIDYGDVRIIGATTDYEYDEYIKSDTAFKTRLKKVSVKEPSDIVIYDILDDLITKYDEISYSKMDLTHEEKYMIINWLIESTSAKHRVYNDKASNPRLVLDIIKEAYAIAAINEREKVSIDDLCEALMDETRLYESAKIQQVSKLKKMSPSRKMGKIIKFVPKK